jgi:hypothetical protein
MSINHDENVDSQMGLKTSFGLLPNRPWGIYGSTEAEYVFFFFTDHVSVDPQLSTHISMLPTLTAFLVELLPLPQSTALCWHQALTRPHG